MRWYHETSPGWLLARRDVITATELKSCLSAYNKATIDQKAGKKLLPAFASLWLTKQSTSMPDTFSSGPAARGHILEPYAIDDFNNDTDNNDNCYMYHWDDVVIKNNGIGWSPDGLGIPQKVFENELFVTDDGLTDNKDNIVCGLPVSFIEIKSYEPSKHMKCLLTPPSKLDERWQMAAAFVTIPSLQRGYLLFYSIDTSMSFGYWYDRELLKEEIQQITEMKDLWNKNVDNLEKMTQRFNRRHTEEEVYDEWQQRQLDVLSIW